jgi:hypothetical protein
MRRFFLLSLVLLALTASAPAPAQEKAVLSAPAVSTTTISDYQILSIFVQRAAMGYDWRVEIHYLDNLGNEYTYASVGADAMPTVKAMNTKDFSAVSMERTALAYLLAKGQIKAATLTGTPLK